MRTATIIGIGLTLLLSACTYNVKGTPTYADTGVQRLYDFPKSGYENLGLHAWGFYRPSFAQPTLDDAWDGISEEVRKMGANACIVRKEKVGGLSARTIEVTCEVLKVG